MHDRSKRMMPLRSKFVSTILNSKISEAKPNPEVVNELLAQWKDRDFDTKSMFMSIPGRRGDVEGTSRCAHEMREAYLGKAASLFRSIDTAIDSMEHTIASMEYVHPELSDEELGNLETWNKEGLTVELGVDEFGEPVLFDFAKTPHLYSVCKDRHGSMGLAFDIVHQLTEAKFVFLGSTHSIPCTLAVPTANSQAEIDGCIEWLNAELDQRARMMDLYDTVSYPLFIFANPDENDWLYDVDGLAGLAENCGYYNMHLVVCSDTSFMSLLKRAEDPTLLTLMSYTQENYGVVLCEGSRYSLYRLLAMKQFDTWLERLEDTDEYRPNDYWGLPVYRDLGTSFVEKGYSYQEYFVLDEAFRSQENSHLHFLRRI